MIRRYSKFNQTHRFNRFANRKHIANAENKCRQILTDIYNCIAENYKKYGFDIDVMTAPCYAESDCSWLWEELDENLSSLDIEPVRWRNHYDSAYAYITPSVFSEGDLVFQMQQNAKSEQDVIEILFDAFLETATGYCNTMLSGWDVEDVMSGDSAEDILETLEYLVQLNPKQRIEDGFITLQKAHEFVDAYNNDVEYANKGGFEEPEEFTSARKSYRHSVAGRPARQKKYTQREIKKMVDSGEAVDISMWSDKELDALRKKGLETVSISKGVNGMNGGLFKDREGNLYAIPSRSTNLFRLV